METAPSIAICYELCIHVSEQHKENLVECLIAMGEQNFVEGSVECRSLLLDGDGAQEDLYVKHATPSPIIFYSEDKDFLLDLENRILNKVTSFEIPKQSLRFELGPIADQNWRESWKASFRPITIGHTFCILPPWENKDAPAFLGMHKIIIDPGMAFGTGQHETTQLCLQMLLDCPKPESVFDVGTGSGILAIAAKMYGAQKVWGCDIDSESINIAQRNAETNGYKDIIFTTEPIAGLQSPACDLVFANIQFLPLEKLFTHILHLTKYGGLILVSGILQTERDDFMKILVSTHHTKVIKIYELGDWCGFLCQKPPL